MMPRETTLLLLLATSLFMAQGVQGAGVRRSAAVTEADGVVSLKCTGTTCSECVSNGCGWTPFYATNSGRCMQKCGMMVDAPCYSTADTFGADGAKQTTAQVCRHVDTVKVDQATCTAALSCGACTSTLQSDGVSTCQWTEATKSCGTAGSCNMMGCGTSTCGAPTTAADQDTAPNTTTTTTTTGAVAIPEPNEAVESSCGILSCLRSWSQQSIVNMPSLFQCIFDCVTI